MISSIFTLIEDTDVSIYLCISVTEIVQSRGLKISLTCIFYVELFFTLNSAC